MIRNCKSTLILSIIPHLSALFFTYNNSLYSSIIISSTFTSIVWHRNKEPQNILLIMDYGTATILSSYEMYNSYSINHTLFLLSFFLNFYILFFNKVVDILSKEKVICYNKWHTQYHIISSIKTTLIAFLCHHRLSQ